MLITAAILVPAAILGSQAGLEFLHPLAVTMLGGLVSLLLVQLFVLPALLLSTAGAAPEQRGPDRPGLRPSRPEPYPEQPTGRTEQPDPRAPEVKTARSAAGSAPS